MKTAVDAFKAVQSHVETIKNDEHAIVGAMSPGDAYAQGDVLIVYVGESIPKGWVKDKQVSQLAPGNTQGSRHIISDMSGITIYKQPNANTLDGPGLVAEKDWTLTHPEHGDRTFGPGVYACQYQRAFAEELRRVQD